MKKTCPPKHLVEMTAVAILGTDVVVEPVAKGASTFVYRLQHGSDILYLRILPEDGATFAPEAAAHATLRAAGCRVPEVVYCEDRNRLLDRSIMITSEIKGTAIASGDTHWGLPEILRGAGRDLAVINNVPVEGFGWIRRDIAAGTHLRADKTTEREFLLSGLDVALDELDGGVLRPGLAQEIRDVISSHASLLDAGRALLAHGDLDATHIFSYHNRYSGLIDLGEIRGTGPYYDLGHMRFHDGEILATRVLPYLLEGYQEITSLPPDADQRIALASLLIGVEFLARTHARLADQMHRHAVAAIAREVSALRI